MAIAITIITIALVLVLVKTLRTYCAPALNSSRVLTIALWCMCYYNPHCTDEETEAQSMSETFSGTHNQ
jgi:hypothetical protein